MKTSSIIYFSMLLLLAGCGDRKFQTYTANVPVYLSWEDLRTSFRATEPRALLQPGKIYLKDGYMYINEYREGIHVIDLSDPSAPLNTAFIEIPGNVDMAIRNDILYADSYTDLVLIDIRNPASPEEIRRIEDILEYVIPPYDYDYPLAEIDQEKGVITGYTIEEYTQEIRYRPSPWPIYYEYNLDIASSLPGSSPGGGSSFGVGGSMARFVAYSDYLYVLESSYLLKTIDIGTTEEVSVEDEKYLGGNVETLFIDGQHLYVGTNTGMHILSLEEAKQPVLLSTYSHITACDPVVVSGNRAYVTLRAGNLCGGDESLLEVLDISNKSNPKLVVSHPMTDPYGLGIDATTLFICEGDYGLKVYDASEASSIPQNKLAEFADIHAWDVIPYAGSLFCIGEDGFQIYDYSNLQDISLIGTIPVEWAED